MKSAPVLLTLSDSKHVVLPVDDDSDLNVVAAFDRRGEYIYTGNAKGKVSLSVSQNFIHSALFNQITALQDGMNLTEKKLCASMCRIRTFLPLVPPVVEFKKTAPIFT